MAYLTDEEQLKKQQQEADQGQIGGGGEGGVLSGGANALSGGQQKTGSGQWTNLNEYLEANKEKGQEMATNAIQNIDTKGRNVSKGTQDLTNQFYQSSGINNDEAKNTSLVNSIFNNPQVYGSDNSYNQQLQTLSQRQPYQGQKSLQEYDPKEYERLQQQAGEYKKSVEATTDPEGRKQALRDIQKGDITRGQSLLNEFIMGSSPDTERVFEAYRGPGLGEMGEGGMYNPGIEENVAGYNTRSQEDVNKYAKQMNMTEQALKNLYGNYQGQEAELGRLKQDWYNKERNRVDYNNHQNNLKRQAYESLQNRDVLRGIAEMGATDPGDILRIINGATGLLDQIYGPDSWRNDPNYAMQDITNNQNYVSQPTNAIPEDSQFYSQEQLANLQALRNLLSGVYEGTQQQDGDVQVPLTPS